MADFINTIDALGDEVVMDSIIDRSITEFKDDTIESVGQYAFSNCKVLANVLLPNVKSIGDRAFEDCTSLGEVLFSEVPKTGVFTFRRCTNLVSADFPKATVVGTFAFNGCTKLERVNLPLAEDISTYVFQSCVALTKIDLPSLKSLSSGAFNNCSNLTAVVIRGDDVCTLHHTDAFENTPIAKGTGYIYVPRALVDSYKAATNWSTYAAQFRALEDYTVDGTITGELDETKI